MVYSSYDNQGVVKVLSFLKSHNTEYLSGQDLSDVLRISRVAVWKHIKKIREMGYKIESTQKPIGIINRALANSSKADENVLDLFAGSGSTLISAEMMRRNCFALELDPKFCDVIIERWENFTGNKAVKI